ncbi:MAG TPA: HEAT repeat domain-containing protein [Pyrinomonadaceae bacterium]|nr:HEAT repeat domain-containing protein [Pyrinomonadaceae bacterium]
MHTISLALGLIVVFAALACTEGVNSAPVVTPLAAQGGIQDRLVETVKQGIAKSKGARFWVVYSIKAHRGIGVDEEVTEVKGTVNKEGLRISLRPASESKNVSVFLLYQGNQIEKVEIHDLDRYRAQDYPVHSLGPVTNAESIALLKSLLPEHSGKLTGERLVLAIGLHDDAQVTPTLLGIVNNSEVSDKERGAAAMWLGQISGQKATLENLARNEALPIEVRKQAIVGLGFTRESDVLPTLQNFYETFSDRELKQQALFAASHTINRAEASAFLTRVKDSDPDQDLRQQAALWLQRLSASPINK